MSAHPSVVDFVRAESAYLTSLDVEYREQVVSLERTGIRARYLESGDGPPVLLVHGGGGMGSSWGPLLPELSGYRALAVDRTGFGLTQYVDHTKVDLRQHAVDFLADLLDALGLETTSIVANSMGGLWSLWFALAHPERVERLALLGTPALILDTSAPGPMRLLGIPGINRVMLAMDAPSPKQVRSLWRRLGHDPRSLTPELIELMVRHQKLPSYGPAWRTLLENVLPRGRRRPELSLGEAELGGVVPDVLYIWGRDDPFGSLAVAERAARATPNAQLLSIGVGHLPWLDDPQGCGEALRSFLHDGTVGRYSAGGTEA